VTYFALIFQGLILSYFFAINSTYTLLILLAFEEVHRQSKRQVIDDYAYMLRSKLVPGVSILVPCHNEEAIIVENVHSLLTSKYSKIEVLVVNDGSTDGSLSRLINAFDLVKVQRVIRDTLDTQPVGAVYKSSSDPRLLVIDKEKGGKADSLNVGLNATRMPYILTIDADVILDEEALLRIMKPILNDPERMVAGGGIVRIVNECVVQGAQVVQPRLPKKPLVLYQIVEYMRAFTAGRAGFARLNSLVIISGAFGVFAADLARDIGGFSRETVGEDLEIMMRLHKYLRQRKADYRVFYAAFPICWTEVPETLGDLGRQRSRWHRGLSEAMWKHKSMIFNPRYGRIGMFAIPVFFFFEWLGPLLEACGYAFFIYLLVTRQFDFWFVVPFFVIAILWGMLLSVMAVAMQDIVFRWLSRWRSLLRLLMFAIAENIGYRQVTVVWRLRGLVAWIFRRKEWGTISRKGYDEVNEASTD
jgi:cellulose synthase/poly-beta-1,6-N-acetylglucosamine synthase-like glycosyltransferase